MNKREINDRVSKLIGSILIFILLIIWIQFELLTTAYFFILIYFIIIISFTFLKDEGRTLVNIIILMFSTFVFIVLLNSWLFEKPIPLVNINIDSQMMTALFTLILAVFTMLNVYVYNKSMNLSRLTSLDISYSHPFIFGIQNKGNFSARDIKVELWLRNISKCKENLDFNRIIENIKEFFKVETRRVDFIGPGDSKPAIFSECLFNKLKIKEVRLVPGFREEVKDSETGIKYLIFLKISYFTDTLYKTPIPLIKTYRISIYLDKKENNFGILELY